METDSLATTETPAGAHAPNLQQQGHMETAMNVPLLRQIQEQITDHPESISMGQTTCGTVMCIAGHAAVLAGLVRADERDWDVIAPAGAAALGLDVQQADRLFYGIQWPRELHQRYLFAVGKEQDAQIVSKRIDHFIATNGAE